MGRKLYFSNEVIDKICKEYTDGNDAVSIGNRHGVSSTMIYNWLKQRDIPRRTKNSYIETSKEVRSSVVRMYTSGFGSTAISKELGISTETVLKIVKSSGIGIRSRDRIYCQIPDCSELSAGRGLCASHYGKWYRRGTTADFVPKNRYLDGTGYVVVKTDDGKTIREHRYVVEKIIGRNLNSDEVVHHKNGDKTDNRPENLEIMTRAEHNKIHSSRMRRFTDSDRINICCELISGEGFNSILEKYDISHSTLRIWLRRFNIPFYNRNRISDNLRLEIIEYVLSGKSKMDASRKFNVSKSTIYKILKDKE